MMDLWSWLGIWFEILNGEMTGLRAGVWWERGAAVLRSCNEASGRDVRPTLTTTGKQPLNTANYGKRRVRFLSENGTATGCGVFLAGRRFFLRNACKGKKLKRGPDSGIVRRMKAKLFGLLLVFSLLLPFRAQAETDEAPRGQNALRKFGRGIANVLFGIVEVPNQITKVTSEQGGGAGATYGVGKGIYRWFGRELTGVYDIVTFPVPVPKGYKPIMHPEFPVEDYEP